MNRLPYQGEIDIGKWTVSSSLSSGELPTECHETGLKKSFWWHRVPVISILLVILSTKNAHLELIK